MRLVSLRIDLSKYVKFKKMYFLKDVFNLKVIISVQMLKSRSVQEVQIEASLSTAELIYIMEIVPNF